MTSPCGECGSPLMPVGSWLFCAKPSCSMYGRGVTPSQIDSDNVASTETGAPSSSTLLPAPATASHGTRAPCVAPVPPSSPARRPAVLSTGADLSWLVSPLDSLLARIYEPGPATRWLMSDRVTNLLAQFKAEDEAEVSHP